MKTSHNLPFLQSSKPYIDDLYEFIIGTCRGLWRSNPTGESYDIIAVINSHPGNGHFDDVMQWFENSCKRDGRALRVVEIWNERLKKHLLIKRGFIEEKNGDVIKKYA